MAAPAIRHPVLLRHGGEDRSVGQRAADAITRGAGSWRFIFAFLAFIAVWMVINGGRDARSFDPFPYILLNLCLSCLAAIQAPVILMSEKRADEKRSALAEMDFDVNRRSEAENRVLARLLGLSGEEFAQRVEEEMRGDLMMDRSPYDRSSPTGGATDRGAS